MVHFFSFEGDVFLLNQRMIYIFRRSVHHFHFTCSFLHIRESHETNQLIIYFQRVDMLKLLLAFTTTWLLLRKFFALSTVETPGKMDPRECAHIVHVSLFVIIFWVNQNVSRTIRDFHFQFIFVTQVLLALLHFFNNQPFDDGNHFGIRDSIVMQYVFVFSTYLADSKTINKVFNRSKVAPVDQ